MSQFTSMRRELAAVTSTLAIGGGFATIGRSFNEAGNSAAAFALAGTGLSHVLIDLARVQYDLKFARLTTDVATASDAMSGLANTAARVPSIFSTLRSVITNHPLLTLGLVLGGITAALYAFGTASDTTAKSLTKIGDAARDMKDSVTKAQAVLSLRQQAGLSFDQRDLFKSQQAGIEQFYGKIRAGDVGGHHIPGEASIQDLATGLGVSIQEIRTFLGGDYTKTDKSAGLFGTTTAPRRADQFIVPDQDVRRLFAGRERRLSDLQQPSPDPYASLFPDAPDSTARFGDLNRTRRYQGTFYGRQQQGGTAQDNGFITQIRQQNDLLAMSDKEREKEITLIQARSIAMKEDFKLGAQEEAAIRAEIGYRQRLIEVNQLEAEFGAALSTGALDAVQNVQHLDQALKNLLQTMTTSLLRFGTKPGFDALGNALGGLFRPAAPGGTSRYSAGDPETGGAIQQ